MLLTSDTEHWVKSGLRDAISLLCKSSLPFHSQLTIDGLLAVTLDHSEVFIVNIKEIINQSTPNSSGDNQEKTEIDLSLQDEDKTEYTAGYDVEGCAEYARDITFEHQSDDSGKFGKRKNTNNIERHNNGVRRVKRRSNSLKDVNTPHILRERMSSAFNGNDVCSETSDCDKIEEPTKDEQQKMINSVDDDNFDLSRVKIESVESLQVFQKVGSRSSENLRSICSSGSASEIWPSDLEFCIPGGGPDGSRSEITSDHMDDLEDTKFTPSKPITLLNVPDIERLKPKNLYQINQPLWRSRSASEETTCVNCGTNRTTVWRRDEHRQLLCNACGCYYKLHKIHRPLHMAREEIKSRCRRPKGMSFPWMLMSDSIVWNKHSKMLQQQSSIKSSTSGATEVMPSF